MDMRIRKKRENMENKLGDNLPNFLTGDNKELEGFRTLRNNGCHFFRIGESHQSHTLGTQWIPSKVKIHNPHLDRWY